MVTLEVAKQAALYHGLATMLNQPSPELSRGKGDGADLSYDEDEEYSGDDMEFLEGASGGYNYGRYYGGSASPSRYMYQHHYPQYPHYQHCNGDMRQSISSSTLVATSPTQENNMHLLSPPRPSEDFLRRPTAFPHHLQLPPNTFHPKPHNDTEYQSTSSGISHVPGSSGLIKANKKFMRQLSFPQEAEEEEVAQEDQNEANNISSEEKPEADDAPPPATATTKMESCNDLSTSSTSSSELTPNDGPPSTTSSNESHTGNIVEEDKKKSENEQADDEHVIVVPDEENEGNEIITEVHENNLLIVREADKPEDKDESRNLDVSTGKNDNVPAAPAPRPVAINEISNCRFLKKKATSLPQCTVFTGIALSPTVGSCANLIAMNYSNNSRSHNLDGGNNNLEERRATMSSTSVLLTSFSLNDISFANHSRRFLSSSSQDEGERSPPKASVVVSRNALHDSNYWSSNCSTRDDNSTLCSPTTSSTSTNGAMMRASQSDSSLARWTDSFDALSRRGLSESALGVPRVVGSSRLLKFLINTYNNGSTTQHRSNDVGEEMDGEKSYLYDYRGRESRGRSAHTFLPPRSKSSDAVLVCEYIRHSAYLPRLKSFLYFCLL